VVPETIGGNNRLIVLGGKKLIPISKKEHTMAVPKMAPQACGQGRFWIVPSSNIFVGQ
jgi:hypothetical protein